MGMDEVSRPITFRARETELVAWEHFMLFYDDVLFTSIYGPTLAHGACVQNT